VLDRTKTHADRSVWQYGPTTATTVPTSTWPIRLSVTATYAAASYYGFASYWGINFQGLDLNSIADAHRSRRDGHRPAARQHDNL